MTRNSGYCQKRFPVQYQTFSPSARREWPVFCVRVEIDPKGVNRPGTPGHQAVFLPVEVRIGKSSCLSIRSPLAKAKNSAIGFRSHAAGIRCSPFNDPVPRRPAAGKGNVPDQKLQLARHQIIQEWRSRSEAHRWTVALPCAAVTVDLAFGPPPSIT